MILFAVEAVLVGSKPPVAVSVRFFTGERHGFGTAAPLLTMASSLQGRAGGSVESSSKLAKHIGGAISTLFAEHLFSSSLDLLQRPSYACNSLCHLVRLPLWQDVAAEHFIPGLLNALSLSSLWGFLALVHKMCQTISPALQTLSDVLPL